MLSEVLLALMPVINCFAQEIEQALWTWSSLSSK